MTLTGMTADLNPGANSLILAIVANTGSVSNAETITGGAAADIITLATQVTAGAINLGLGADSLTLGNFANSVTLSNVETITGNADDDAVTLATAITAGTIDSVPH
jgi:hypothetical protein